jgi:hypothetical protein
MKMDKAQVFLVLGDNGGGNSGNSVFGVYPTQELAEARVAKLEALYKAGEDGCECMWVDMVSVGAEGADCRIPVEG